MKTAAFELAPRKIRVNAIAPGPILYALFEIGIYCRSVSAFQIDLAKRVP